MQEFETGCGVAALLRRAAARDENAWRELVDRNRDVVWGAARAYSADRGDAEDVWQVTWLLLAENLHRLRDPEALPGWLVTTARRESLRLAKARNRESPAGLGGVLIDVVDGQDGPESAAMKSALSARLAEAFGQLSHRCQQLLRVMAVAPETSYEQISSALGMARGSIGPKRQRCLRALRDRLAALGTQEVAG